MASDFVNDPAYINGGSEYPNNGSGLGKFQSAMQIRRGSHLNCFNSVAIGWPIGLIIDGQKGDTRMAAKDGKLKLQNVWFADMDVTGSDANKVYDDVLVKEFLEDGTPVLDNTQKSFSSSWFLAQPGNKSVSKADASSWFTAAGWIPTVGSPLLTAASFTDDLLQNGFDKVSYIGAFANGEVWTTGWTNFDPQNADY